MSRESTDSVSCRSCGADIVFLRTASGKTMPVNAETASPEDTQFDSKRHTSHFATCDSADKHRRPR
jgi:hypothetical protein